MATAAENLAQAPSPDTAGTASGVTFDVSGLDPAVAALAQLIGLISPAGAGSYQLNESWFAHPIDSTSAGVQQNGDQLAALLGQLLSAAGGNALGIPVSDPALLGTWYPISTPGSSAAGGLYAVSYPVDPAQPGGAQVFGLGALYQETFELSGAAEAGPAGIAIKAWGLLPLVSAGGGSYGLALGAAGFPLVLGIAIESPSGPVIDVAGVSFTGVKTTASIDVTAASPVSASTVILRLQLPGETAPQNRTLAQLANISGNELLSTAASLALAALGSALGGEQQIQYLLPVFGLNPTVPGTDTRLPLLDWTGLLATAAGAGNVSEPFIDWFTTLVSDGALLSAWLGAIGGLLGVATPQVAGNGSRQDPFRIPIVQSATLGTLSFTLASTTDANGLRQLFPGLAITAQPIAVGGSTVLQIEGALELAEFDLLPGGSVTYPGPSSLQGRANLALVDSDPSQPLFSGQIDQLQYSFGALRAGVQLSGTLQVIPYCQLTDVQTPNGKYDVLDLTQPGQLLQTALDELVGDIVQELSALLGIAQDPQAPFGSQIAALIGFTPPALPEGVTWPAELAPPLSAARLLATLQDPLGALGGYYGNLLQTAVGGQPAFFYLVGELAKLLQQTGSGITVTGSGTAASPWLAALAGSGLPVALSVFTQSSPDDPERLRLTFGLDLAPPLQIPGGPDLVLDVSIAAFSVDVTTAAPFAAGNPLLLPAVGVALELPSGFSTPPVFGAHVEVASASLSMSWNRWNGFGWSMQAAQPALVVGDTTLPVGQDLDFDDTTSLASLVTQQAQTFAPILAGLLGIAVCRTGSPAGIAVTGLLGLLPALQPYLPQGLTWPAGMPALQLTSFSDPIAALKTQAAGLIAADANARAAATLLAWALQPAGQPVPTLAGSGTYADPLQVPLGLADGIGLWIWYDASQPMAGLGFGYSQPVALAGGVTLDAGTRLDMIEIALGANPVSDMNPVPSLTLFGDFTLAGAAVDDTGGATVSQLGLGVRFGLSGSSLTVSPVFDLTVATDGAAPAQITLDDYLTAVAQGATQLQQLFLADLNAAVQAAVAASQDDAAFQNVYSLLVQLGVALEPTAGNNRAYGVDPAGFQALISDPSGYLAARATAVLQSPESAAQLFGVLAQLLGFQPPPVPTAVLDVLAAMGYLAPAGLGYAPLPEAFVEFARHPVQTVTGRFLQLVTSPPALAALVGQLQQDLRAVSFGPFTASITDGRFVQIALTAPYPIGSLCLLTGQVQLDLQQQLVSAQVSVSLPAIGVAVVSQIRYAVAGTTPAPFTVSLAWGDGVLPAPPPLQVYPFDSSAFIQSLAGVAPQQALSTFVTQVFDSQVLAPYPLAQVTFSALGLAFKDASGAWHLKSLLGLFDDPLGWLLSDAVLGASGNLNLQQMANVLAAIPGVSSANGVSVAQQSGGIRISGLPYNVQIDIGVDLAANVLTFASSLSGPLPLALGDASVQALSLALSLGSNYQPGFTGNVSVAGLPQQVAASFGYDGGFSLAIGQSGGPVLQLLPFDGWVSLVAAATRIAIQTLLQQLTSTLLDALAQNGAADFVTRLRTAAGLLDVNGLVTTLAGLTDPSQFLQAALDWLIARVAPANVANTTQAVTTLASGLITGLSASNGLITYQPGAGIPLTLLAGSVIENDTQQLGLWLELDPPPLSVLQIGVDRTGVAFNVATPSTPIWTFGVHLSVPIAGQTGPELDFVYNAASQSFQLSFDPQGGGSPLARELYPQLFGPDGPTASAVEAWLLQILLQVLPRYVSLVVLNTTAVKQWLDAPLVAGGPTPGFVLTSSQLLVSSNGTYALNSFSALAGLSPLTFLGGFLKALLATQVKVLSLGEGGGVWLEPNPAAADSYGLRVTVPDFPIPGLKNVVLQLGASDASWITSAGGTAPVNPGISAYVPLDPTSLAPSFGDLELNLANLGIDFTGVNQGPLVELSRFQLGAVAPRLLFTLQFDDGSPSVTFGAALELADIAFALAPTTLTDNANPVVQNLLGAGGSTSVNSTPTDPSFSAIAAYVSSLYVDLIAPDGSSAKQILIPVQRSFGPLHVHDIGFGWNDPRLNLLFDGGVALAGLSVDVQGLVVGVPVTQPVDFDSYTLDLAGLAVAFSGGGVTVAGGLLKKDPPLSYDGAALISLGSAFSIAALGSYAVIPVQPDNPNSELVPSLFVFAVLSAALGGPPAFFITGFAGGFSYNRGLTLPQPALVQTYPLVQAAMQPASFFGPDTEPGSALEKLSDIVYPSVGEYWVAAGVKFTSYQLISSFAMISVLFGRSFEINLIGSSVMTMPPMVPQSVALAYIEMGLVASFQPDAGTVRVVAQLTPNSFVLSPSAKLTGGFAFALWYSGPHAGDFVVTFGGYHPAFEAPDYYPAVPRLGLRWPISSSPDISISGDAYFALTPSAVMAGSHLSLVFDAGPLRAWLNAAADFILSWKPFFFDAEIAVSVGVSFQTTIAGVSLTLTVSLGCDLYIYGPPTGGLVSVDWYVISFTIPFGAQDVQPDVPFATWDDFAQALLPTPDDAPNTGTATAALAAGGDPLPQQVLKVRAAEGLLGEDATNGWLIQPFGFTLRADTAVPATAATVAGTALPAGPAIGVRPMHLQSISTPLTLTIQWAATGAAVTLPATTVTLGQVTGGAPQALWAQTDLDPNATPTADLVENAVLGVTITGDQIASVNPIPPLADPAIDLSVFQYDQIGPLTLPLAAPAYQPAAQLPQGNNFQQLMTTVMAPAVVAVRNAVFQALQDREIEAPADPSLSVLSTSADAIYLAPPVLAQIGFDLAAAVAPGTRVSKAAAPPAPAPAPMPAAAPKLLGGAFRYRLPGARPSPDGVLLPSSSRATLRWVDVDDGPAAWSALGVLDGDGADGRRLGSLFPGCTAFWQLDPAGATTLQGSGTLALHVAAFDRNHRLVSQQLLLPGQAVDLPAGAAFAAATGVEDGAPPLPGWQADSRMVQLNGYYFLGDRCVVRPQAGPRLRQTRRHRRRGLLDGRRMMAANQVSDVDRRITPGWIETVLPGGLRSLAVLFRGDEPPAVSVAVKSHPEEYVEPAVLEAQAVLRGPAGGALFFALPAAATAGDPQVSVLVRPWSPEHLQGVFGSPESPGDLRARWPEARVHPPGTDPAEPPRRSTITVSTQDLSHLPEERCAS